MANLLAALSLLLVVACIGVNAGKLAKQVKVEVVSTAEMDEILKQYPNAVEMKRKVLGQVESPEKKVGITPAVVVEYVFGQRVTGDSIVFHDNKSLNWNTPQSVQSIVTYPATGTAGKIVSYVSVVCIQSTNEGRTYVVWGGVGYTYIKIIVEAFNTNIYEHFANIYGH